MLKTAFEDTAEPVQSTMNPIATFTVWPSHAATLEPAAPEIRERYLRRMLVFSLGGPLGHTVQPQLSDEFFETTHRRYVSNDGKVERAEMLRIPQGFIDEVVEDLQELGYDVVVKDHRKDSSRWVLADDWKQSTPRPLRKIVKAVGAERALRVIAGNSDLIVETVVAVIRAHPKAKIAVALTSYKQLYRFRKKLGRQLGAEVMGLYTSKRKQSARVSVGMIRQLPKGAKGEFDLLILPYALKAVDDETLRIATSGQYRRILSFSPSRWTTDENINRRLAVIAGAVFPKEKAKVPVTAVVLGTHGTTPKTAMTDAYAEKRFLYWSNGRRNRRIAEVAKRLRLATRKAVRSLGVEDEALMKQVVTAARVGVAVMIETPEHARELAEKLPGWVVWTAGDVRRKRAPRNCGIIVTELYAAENVLRDGVLIRADGTKWQLPQINWPSADDVECGVLIDFADAFHPIAIKNARLRMESYQEAGIMVWTPGNVHTVSK